VVGRGNLDGVKESRLILAMKVWRWLGVGGRGGRRKREQQKGGARFGFIGTQDSVEVKGRESSRAARHRSVGGAGVLDGVAWQALGIVYPTWNGEGRTAEAAWWWEEG
jgi:hypothetical protein